MTAKQMAAALNQWDPFSSVAHNEADAVALAARLGIELEDDQPVSPTPRPIQVGDKVRHRVSGEVGVVSYIDPLGASVSRGICEQSYKIPLVTLELAEEK